METSLQLADATAPAVPTAAAGGDPVTVYLARLTSAESRRAMVTSLELLAELLIDGQPADRAGRARRRRDGSPLSIAGPWQELRYGHTQALRSWLAEHCSPAAANRHLAALRGVLREAWRLGLMNGEDLARAVDLASVPGTSLPAGRYVEDGEVRRLVAACLGDHYPPGRPRGFLDDILRPRRSATTVPTRYKVVRVVEELARVATAAQSLRTGARAGTAAATPQPPSGSSDTTATRSPTGMGPAGRYLHRPACR